LCRTCIKAPIAALAIPRLDPDLPFNSDAVQQCLCKCETTGVWLCQPCGRRIRGADQEYRRFVRSVPHSYPEGYLVLTKLRHLVFGAGAINTEKFSVGSGLASVTAIGESYVAEAKIVSRPKIGSKRSIVTPRTLVIAVPPRGSMSPRCGRQLRHLRLPPSACLTAQPGRRLGRQPPSGP
jgi:hypothetical protein